MEGMVEWEERDISDRPQLSLISNTAVMDVDHTSPTLFTDTNAFPWQMKYSEGNVNSNIMTGFCFLKTIKCRQLAPVFFQLHSTLPSLKVTRSNTLLFTLCTWPKVTKTEICAGCSVCRGYVTETEVMYWSIVISIHHGTEK